MFKKVLTLLTLLIFVASTANAALTLSRDSVENSGSETKMEYTVTFDSSYATGGESLTKEDVGLFSINRVKISSASGYLFEYDYTNEKLKAYNAGNAAHTHTFTGNPVSQQVLNITDDDTAATNGVAVYIGSIDGVNGFMQFVSPTNADGTGTIGIGVSSYAVRDDDTAASAYGAVQLYFDEDGAESDERLLANFANGLDHFITLSPEAGSVTQKLLKVKHDASASSNGVAVYFDEDAANAYDRLLFVSPTDVAGSGTTFGDFYAGRGLSSGTNSTSPDATAAEVDAATDLSSLSIKVELYGK